MLAPTLLVSCLILLSSVPANAAAAKPRIVPDATTGRLAARAVISGGNTCYFRCPDSFVTGGGQGELAVKGTYYEPDYPGLCAYGGTVSNTGDLCWYTSEGRLDTAEENEPGCPDFALDAGCTPTGSGPTDPTYFKRSTTRGPTRAQEIIRARQYRPKRVNRRKS